MHKVGLVGLGFMGTGHFNNYKLLEKNGLPVKLTAICDVDKGKFQTGGVAGNLDVGGTSIDLSGYSLYNDMEEMIKEEGLSYVDLCLPTYLHAPMAIRAMELGVNVFCEKPMALSEKECRAMTDCAVRTGKKLMIGQTLRYWNVYEYLKECIDDKRYGECSSAYFFRGGSTPIWSWENWLMKREKAGGCLLDQHVHDVDAINWLFGMPEAVSSIGKNVIEGSGFDAVSTNYIYSDKVVNAQDDWTMNGKDFSFQMLYRVNFKNASLIYEKGVLTVYPVDAEKFIPELPAEGAYYKELRLFINLLETGEGLDYIKLLESHTETVALAEAEDESAGKRGELVKINPKG